MTSPVITNGYVLANGTASSMPVTIQNRVPTGNDTKWKESQFWLFGTDLYILTGFTSFGGNLQAQWAIVSGSSTNVNTLSDTAGTIVYPALGNIQLNGTANRLTVTAGTNELTFNTIDAGSIRWTDVSAAFAVLSNNGYIVTGTATGTLPASPSNGDEVGFIVDTTQILTIQANTGQIIRIGSMTGTSGGTCTSMFRGDSAQFVYHTATTAWISWTSPQGTWTLA